MGPVKAGKYEYRPESLVGLREKLRFTQVKMAELLGVRPNTLSRWETGSTIPDADSLAAIYSVAMEHAVQPHFFQQWESTPTRQKERHRLAVMLDYPNMRVSAHQLSQLDDRIMEAIERRIGNYDKISNPVFKAFVGGYDSLTRNALQQLDWRVAQHADTGLGFPWTSTSDLPISVAAQARSYCGEDPTGTTFVLVTNDGDYSSLLHDLKRKQVLVYLFTLEQGYNQHLVAAVGKKKWARLPGINTTFIGL